MHVDSQWCLQSSSSASSSELGAAAGFKLALELLGGGDAREEVHLAFDCALGEGVRTVRPLPRADVPLVLRRLRLLEIDEDRQPLAGEEVVVDERRVRPAVFALEWWESNSRGASERLVNEQSKQSANQMHNG